MSFKEQIMSKDKYPSIFFAPNGDYRVYYPSNLLRNARSFESWGIFSGDIRSRDVFRPIAHERKDLMDYNALYFGRVCLSLIHE